VETHDLVSEKHELGLARNLEVEDHAAERKQEDEERKKGKGKTKAELE
jgi:hypothetical protein